MTVSLAFSEDNDPLSYDRLDGEWRQWYETAHRFEHKVPAQDRGDIRHNIILELALARARDGDKPDNPSWMYRIASFTVAQYWRDYYKWVNGIDCGHCSNQQRKKCKRDNLYSECPRAIRIESLNKPIVDSEGHLTELGEIIADDKAGSAAGLSKPHPFHKSLSSFPQIP